MSPQHEDFSHEPPHGWMEGARCLEVDPEIFFPTKKSSPAASAVAKAICERCHGLEPCRAMAMAEPAIEGIWGGLAEHERRAIRKAAK